MNFYSEFGFEQSSLTGIEQGDSYNVEVGFLVGAHDQTFTVEFEMILHSAGGQSQLAVVISAIVQI